MRPLRWTPATSAVVAVALTMCGHTARAQQDGSTRADASTAVHVNPDNARATDPLATRISVMLVSATVPEALATVAAQSGLRFTYSSDDLPATTRISVAEHDVSVGAVLRVILAQTRLHAVAMTDGSIVLAPGSGRLAAQSAAGAPPTRSGRMVSGRVLQPDGSPVQGAMLGLTGVRDTSTTGPDGGFAIPNLAPGSYVLSVRRLGFSAARLAVTISDRDTALVVRLVPVVTKLPSVTTTGPREGYHRVGFDVRMQSGVGQFLTYDQIQALHAQTLTDVLLHLRGVNLTGGVVGVSSPDPGSVLPPPTAIDNVQLPSRCTAVAIDGVAQVGTNEIDLLITPLEVGAIEAYPAAERPGSDGPKTGKTQLPVMIVGNPDLVPPECTLVLIWTRQRLGIPGP